MVVVAVGMVVGLSQVVMVVGMVIILKRCANIGNLEIPVSESGGDKGDDDRVVGVGGGGGVDGDGGSGADGGSRPDAPASGGCTCTAPSFGCTPT